MGKRIFTCSKTFPTPVLTSNDDDDENEEAGDCLSSKASRRCSPMILFVVVKSSRYARMGGTSHCHVSSTSCIYHNLDYLQSALPPHIRDQRAKKTHLETLYNFQNSPTQPSPSLPTLCFHSSFTPFIFTSIWTSQGTVQYATRLRVEFWVRFEMDREGLTEEVKEEGETDLGWGKEAGSDFCRVRRSGQSG